MNEVLEIAHDEELLREDEKDAMYYMFLDLFKKMILEDITA